MILFDIILKSAWSYFRKTVEQKGERVSALSFNKLNPNCWREEESWVEAADQRPCLRLCPKDTNSSDILVVLQMMMIMRSSSKRTLMAHRLLAGNVYSIKFPQRQKEKWLTRDHISASVVRTQTQVLSWSFLEIGNFGFINIETIQRVLN